ncbi:MAG: hypothetical protein R3263_04490 [Myxococcota bacterium]|nr:hypothetical protein [Myxococcota bacterium]
MGGHAGRGAEAILRRQPFLPALRLAAVEPLAGARAHSHSGTSYRAIDAQGRRYKLRACRTRLRARALERYVRGLPELLPGFVARSGRLVLLEYLEDHRPVTRQELVRRAADLGRLAARVHARSRELAAGGVAGRWLVALRWRVGLARDLALLRRRGVLPPEDLAALRARARAHLRRRGLPVALELDDQHKGNFVIREIDGELRYVDEEGVRLGPLGIGLATLLKTARRRFLLDDYREGYAEIRDVRRLDDPYVEFLLLLDAVRRVALRLRTGRRPDRLPDEIGHLRAIAASAVGDLAWRFPGFVRKARPGAGPPA